MLSHFFGTTRFKVFHVPSIELVWSPVSVTNTTEWLAPKMVRQVPGKLSSIFWRFAYSMVARSFNSEINTWELMHRSELFDSWSGMALVFLYRFCYKVHFLTFVCLASCFYIFLRVPWSFLGLEPWESIKAFKTFVLLWLKLLPCSCCCNKNFYVYKSQFFKILVLHYYWETFQWIPYCSVHNTMILSDASHQYGGLW